MADEPKSRSESECQEAARRLRSMLVDKRVKIGWFEEDGIKMAATLLEVAEKKLAEANKRAEELAVELSGVRPFQKDGETAGQCIERNWQDSQNALDLFAKERIRAEKAEAALSEQQQRQKEPPPGLLVSIALRLDHGLFMPNILTGETEEQHQRRIEVALSDARKAWEECSGNGFYSPEREEGYMAIRKDGIHALDLIKIPRPDERSEP